MEKVFNLNSAKPSYLIAKQKPRSLKYYLSAGLHHQIVGRFAASAFFADTVYNSENQSRDNFSEQMENDSQPTSNSNNSEGTEEKSTSMTPEGFKKDKEKSSGIKTGRYTNVSEPGPFANYEQPRKNPASVKEMVKLSNEVLASASTVFPIDPFPDSIVLDRTTLNITKRTFFFSNDTLSIRIEDILNAHVNVGPFLGSLTIASRILSSEDHFTVNNLWRKDAIHLKHMIQGYIIALHNEIEISHLSKQELIDTISELGHDLNS